MTSRVRSACLADSVPKLHKKAALGLKLAFVLAGGGLRSQRGSGVRDLQSSTTKADTHAGGPKETCSIDMPLLQQVQPIDALSESSGGNALLAALGLCAAIDVYGAGLLRADLKEVRAPINSLLIAHGGDREGVLAGPTDALRARNGTLTRATGKNCRQHVCAQ